MSVTYDWVSVLVILRDCGGGKAETSAAAWVIVNGAGVWGIYAWPRGSEPIQMKKIVLIVANGLYVPTSVS